MEGFLRPVAFSPMRHSWKVRPSIQVNVINASKTGKRAAIVEAVRTLAPHLLPWVYMSV